MNFATSVEVNGALPTLVNFFEAGADGVFLILLFGEKMIYMGMSRRSSVSLRYILLPLSNEKSIILMNMISN